MVSQKLTLGVLTRWTSSADMLIRLFNARNEICQLMRVEDEDKVPSGDFFISIGVVAEILRPLCAFITVLSGQDPCLLPSFPRRLMQLLHPYVTMCERGVQLGADPGAIRAIPGQLLDVLRTLLNGMWDRFGDDMTGMSPLISFAVFSDPSEKDFGAFRDDVGVAVLTYFGVSPATVVHRHLTNIREELIKAKYDG